MNNKFEFFKILLIVAFDDPVSSIVRILSQKRWCLSIWCTSELQSAKDVI